MPQNEVSLSCVGAGGLQKPPGTGSNQTITPVGKTVKRQEIKITQEGVHQDKSRNLSSCNSGGGHLAPKWLNYL